MKLFRNSILFITLLLTNTSWAPDFPASQVATIWLPDKQLATIFGVQIIDNIEWPKLLTYVKETPLPFAYLHNQSEKNKKKFYAWFDMAIAIVHNEEQLKKEPFENQKRAGSAIIKKVADNMLQDYCSTNYKIKDDAQLASTIMGNIPREIDTYLDTHWTEDWLEKARAAMPWTMLNPILAQATKETVFTNEDAINTQWLCSALKAAEKDIANQRTKKEKDPILAPYLISKPKQSARADTDARTKIIGRIKDLIPQKWDQLPKAQKDLMPLALYQAQIELAASTALDTCVNQPAWVGPEYTAQWTNLTEFLNNKINKPRAYQKSLTTGTYNIGDQWLNQALAHAKKDIDKENISDEVVLREAQRKITDAISASIDAIKDPILNKRTAKDLAHNTISKTVEADLQPKGVINALFGQ